MDQRKTDFDQDYEEFCREINDLQVGFMIQIRIIYGWILIKKISELLPNKLRESQSLYSETEKLF